MKSRHHNEEPSTFAVLKTYLETTELLTFLKICFLLVLFFFFTFLVYFAIFDFFQIKYSMILVKIQIYLLSLYDCSLEKIIFRRFLWIPKKWNLSDLHFYPSNISEIMPERIFLSLFPPIHTVWHWWKIALFFLFIIT